MKYSSTNLSENLIYAEEVGKLCHVPPRTVSCVFRYRKDFPRAVKPGRKLMWDRREVLEWLDKQRVKL